MRTLESDCQIALPKKLKQMRKPVHSKIPQNEPTTQGSKININQANQELLESLPGIGEKLAQEIIKEREIRALSIFRGAATGFRHWRENDSKNEKSSDMVMPLDLISNDNETNLSLNHPFAELSPCNQSQSCQ